MTATADKATELTAPKTVDVTIDGIEASVPEGTLIIRAAEQVGIEIPRFCDHPALKPAGACRQCLVGVASPDREGNLRAFPKPQASCTMTVTPGMVVNTQNTSEEADRAQKSVLELLLINHPLDCPVCDKGGECPLQNQAMSHGHSDSRFVDVKRVFEKPLALSTEVLLDRERCVLCQRCTRFSDEISGDPFIDLQERGARSQIGTFDTDVLNYDGYAPAGLAAEDESGKPFSSYYSGNTVQICPVGALTSAAYRFRSRPFDLVSSPGIAEHDSSGSAIRTDHRRGKIVRRLADNDPTVNEDWITDKDRFAFAWQNQADRLERPLVRNADGELVEASWPEALEAAAAGLAKAIAPKKGKGAAVLPGGRVTMEDAYAYGKFARAVLGTNDVDSRNRPASAEEQDFLGARVAGVGMGVTFADLENAPVVLMVDFEPEDEGGVVFLRMNKSKGKQRVFTVAPFLSRGAAKLDATLVPCVPGAEADALAGITGATFSALKLAGAVIVLGERLASARGGFSEAVVLADKTGAKLAWIPRRAGERGAADMGALPGILPGGAAATSATARRSLADAWGLDSLPLAPGRSAHDILEAAASGSIGALVVGGVTLSDLPVAAKKSFKKPFLVSLEVRRTDVAELADVVLPVAPPSEKSGTYVNWEGRLRSFATAISTDAMSDHRVLDMLARQMGVNLGTPTVEAINGEMLGLPIDDAERTADPKVAAPSASSRASKRTVLASWHQLVDSGVLQDGEPYLAGTGKVPVARMSPVTAHTLGVSGSVRITGSVRGSITLPLAVTEDMVDGVVWVPTNSPGSAVARTLGVDAGEAVAVKGVGA